MFEGGTKQTAKRAWEFTRERLNPANYELNGSNVNFVSRSEILAKAVSTTSESSVLAKNIRADAWKGDFGKVSDGLAQRVKDLPNWDPMRTKFARMLKDVRKTGGYVGKHSNEAMIAGFGGNSIETGIWFRWNPEKVRIVDMIEETIHWQQIKTGLPTSGYSVETLEIMAKRSIINEYPLSNSLKFELLDDIRRVKDGSYVTHH